jgi:5-methylcytosine-specific restriction protein A
MKVNLKKFKRKKLSKQLRIKIFERDNYECQNCNKNLFYLPEERVIDHKIPLSKGGSNSIGNLWLLCNKCDKNKKNKLIPKLVSMYIKAKIKYLERKQRNKK